MVLGISMLVFIPFFFFASEYAQIGLGKSASGAGLYLLYFFLGFVIASQIGGRMLDRGGAKRPVVWGCAACAVGFYLLAGEVTDLDFGSQQWSIVLAGAGMGMMLTPASTDAVNRASRLSYGEATGITQTVRNYAASLGLAVLGTVSVSRFQSRVRSSLVARGVPSGQASDQARQIAQSHQAPSGSGSIPHYIQMDFAYATRTVFYAMAGIMLVAAVVAWFGLKHGVQAEDDTADAAGTAGAGSREVICVPTPRCARAQGPAGAGAFPTASGAGRPVPACPDPAGGLSGGPEAAARGLPRGLR